VTLRCWIVWSWCAAVLFTSVGWGCERQAAQNRAPGEIRIASLSPAMTTTLQQVGLGPLMVGRSAFCADADELPVVGDLQHINAEQLVRVNPSHIFVQRSGDAVDGILQQLAQKHGWVVVSQSIVDLPDVIRLMDRIATLFAHKDVAQKCHVLSGQISDALQKTPGEQSIRVLIISADQSPLAWGRDTYLGQLVDAAGGENVMAGNRWTSLSLEDVVRLKADIVIVPTGVEPVDLRALEAAVEPNRIHVLFFPSIDIPGPHLASLRPAIERILREASVKAP
jgi:ABC-type Fe3+-hydroxamate transport system substrate-binding protein